MRPRSCSELPQNATTTPPNPASATAIWAATDKASPGSIGLHQTGFRRREQTLSSGRTCVLLRFQRDDVENQKRSYLCTRNFSFQGSASRYFSYLLSNGELLSGFSFKNLATHPAFRPRLCREMEGKLMHKEKLKTEFKGNRSIPDRGTSRPENVSAKQRKQYAHNAPALRAGSKARGYR